MLVARRVVARAVAALLLTAASTPSIANAAPTWRRYGPTLADFGDTAGVIFLDMSRRDRGMAAVRPSGPVAETPLEAKQ